MSATVIYPLKRFRPNAAVVIGGGQGTCMGSSILEGTSEIAIDRELDPEPGDIVAVLVRDLKTGQPFSQIVKHFEIVDGRPWLLSEEGCLRFDDQMEFIGVVVAIMHFSIKRYDPFRSHPQKERPEVLLRLAQRAAPLHEHVFKHGLTA